MNYKLYYTSEEVAKIYHCEITTIRKWAREGKLKAHKIGKRWLYSMSMINREYSEKTALEILGEDAQRMNTMNPFDILKNNDRIDVKASIKKCQDNTKYWSFSIDQFSGNKIQENKKYYCDYFLFICYNKNRSEIKKAYLLPYKVVCPDGIETSNFTLNEKNKDYEKYLIDEIDIPTFLRQKS